MLLPDYDHPNILESAVMRHASVITLLFVLLASFAVVSLQAQDRNTKPTKGKAQARGRLYVFGQVKDWRADSTRKLTPTDDY